MRSRCGGGPPVSGRGRAVPASSAEAAGTAKGPVRTVPRPRPPSGPEGAGLRVGPSARARGRPRCRTSPGREAVIGWNGLAGHRRAGVRGRAEGAGARAGADEDAFLTPFGAGSVCAGRFEPGDGAGLGPRAGAQDAFKGYPAVRGGDDPCLRGEPGRCGARPFAAAEDAVEEGGLPGSRETGEGGRAAGPRALGPPAGRGRARTPPPGVAAGVAAGLRTAGCRPLPVARADSRNVTASGWWAG